MDTQRDTTIHINNRYPYYNFEGLNLPNPTPRRAARKSAQAVPKTTPATHSVPMMHPPMAGVFIRALAFLTGPFRLVN